jgi:hypothetical protein
VCAANKLPTATADQQLRDTSRTLFSYETASRYSNAELHTVYMKIDTYRLNVTLQ